MAIDPSISLNIRPVEPIDITKLQQIRNLAAQEESIRQSIAASQAQEALSRAQLPGVQAESDIRVRAQRFNTDVLGNPQEFTKPDGTPDVSKFINFASSKGFLREAQSIAASDLQNQGTAIANARSEQDRQVALTNFIKTGIDHTSLLLHSTPENQRGEALKSYAGFMNTIVPNSGNEVIKMFGEQDPKTGMITVNPARVSSIRTATINAATQESQGLDFAQRFYTKEGQDPNSQQSRDFRDFVRVQTGGNVKIPEGTSLFSALMNPAYRDTATQYIQSQVMPAGTRAQAVGTAATITSIMQNYDSAISAISQVPAQLLPTRLGTIGSDAFKKYITQNPALAGLETAIQVHNNQFPNDLIDPMRQSLGEIKAKLQAGRRQLESQAAGAQAVSQTAVLPTAGNQPPVGTDVAVAQRLAPLEQVLARAIQSGDQVAVDRALANLNSARTANGLPPATARMAAPTPAAAPVAAPAAAPAPAAPKSLKAGTIFNGLPVLTPQQGRKYPKDAPFYGTDGKLYRGQGQ